MSRRTTGVAFCAIAAVLFGVRYLVAGLIIVAQHPGTMDSGMFAFALSYAGTPLLTMSILSLIAGIAYLVWAEVDDFRGHNH